MCSRTAANRDRRSAMMFHYIDYADLVVRTGNRQRRENRGGKRVDKQMANGDRNGRDVEEA